jgi:hypothetical protein
MAFTFPDHAYRLREKVGYKKMLMKLSGDPCVTHQNQGLEKIGPCRRKCEFPEKLPDLVGILAH